MQYAIKNGILDVQHVRQQNEMDKRRKTLDSHPYSLIYNEKKGRWYTRFKGDNGTIQRNRPTKEALEDLIVEFYNNGGSFEKKTDKYTFAEAHDRWQAVQEEYGKDPNTLYRYHSDWNRFFSGTKFSRMNILTMTPLANLKK